MKGGDNIGNDKEPDPEKVSEHRQSEGAVPSLTGFSDTVGSQLGEWLVDMIPDRRSVTVVALNSTSCRIEASNVLVSAAIDDLMGLPNRIRKTDTLLTYRQIYEEFIKALPEEWKCNAEYRALMEFFDENIVHHYRVTAYAVDYVFDVGKRMRPELYERAFLFIAAALDVLAGAYSDDQKEIPHSLYKDVVRMITEILDKTP